MSMITPALRHAAVLAVAAIMAAPTSVQAQSNASTGMLLGTVVDPMEAPLPGAAIEVRHTSTGFVRRDL